MTTVGDKMAGFGTYYDFNCGNTSSPGVGCNAYGHPLCRTCEFHKKNESSHGQCPDLWCLKNHSQPMAFGFFATDRIALRTMLPPAVGDDPVDCVKSHCADEVAACGNDAKCTKDGTCALDCQKDPDPGTCLKKCIHFPDMVELRLMRCADKSGCLKPGSVLQSL